MLIFQRQNISPNTDNPGGMYTLEAHRGREGCSYSTESPFTITKSQCRIKSFFIIIPKKIPTVKILIKELQLWCQQTSGGSRHGFVQTCHHCSPCLPEVLLTSWYLAAMHYGRCCSIYIHGTTRLSQATAKASCHLTLSVRLSGEQTAVASTTGNI